MRRFRILCYSYDMLGFFISVGNRTGLDKLSVMKEARLKINIFSALFGFEQSFFFSLLMVKPG